MSSDDLISRSDDIINRSDDLISRSDDLISRSHNLISRGNELLNKISMSLPGFRMRLSCLQSFDYDLPPIHTFVKHIETTCHAQEP